MTWQVYATGFPVSMENDILRPFPPTLSLDVIPGLIQMLDSSVMCSGNFEQHFVEIAEVHKGRLLSRTGETVAILDEKVCIQIDGEWHFSTVRHVNCSILLTSQLSICPACSRYRNTLRVMVSRHKKAAISNTHGNVRYLRTPQRYAYIKSLQRAIRTKNRQLARLTSKLQDLMSSNLCLELDDKLNADILKVVEDHKTVTEKDDFKQIFWEQQVAS